MRGRWGMTLLAGASAVLFLGPPQVFAQACRDEISMVDGSKQAIAELQENVKKESLQAFETHNHQKGVVNKLTFHDSVLRELLKCLDKAAQDPASTKEAQEAAKTQHDAYAKLQEKIGRQRGAIKNAQTPRNAKTLIENLDLAP